MTSNGFVAFRLRNIEIYGHLRIFFKSFTNDTSCFFFALGNANHICIDEILILISLYVNDTGLPF